MEITLNIYKGGEIEKTYAIEDFRVTMGVCEDVLNVINLDKLAQLDYVTDEDFMEFLPMLMQVASQFKPLVKQVFPEMTDEEYRCCDPQEVCKAAWDIILYALQSLFSIPSGNVGGGSPQVPPKKSIKRSSSSN